MIPEWKLQKMIEIYDIIKDIEKGMKKKGACEKHNMPYRTFHRWEKRFQTQGKNGLLDKRAGSKPWKVTRTVRSYLVEKRKDDPSISAQEIVNKLESEGIVRISVKHANRILREENIHKNRGRVTGKKIGIYKKRTKW